MPLLQIFKKLWEYSKEVNICFADLAKAYGCILRDDKLSAVLLQYGGIDGQLLTATESPYMHSEDCVCVDIVTTKLFRVKMGQRQDCTASCFLFRICVDRIVTKSESCGGEKLVTGRYNIWYLRMILFCSTLPKMVSSKLLTDFRMLPE